MSVGVVVVVESYLINMCRQSSRCWPFGGRRCRISSGYGGKLIFF